MKVNEIFYSIQGEGYYAGHAAVFVRFAKCNLACPFCDTDFKAYKDMTEYEIVDEVCNQNIDCHFVVLTGGEPTLYDLTLLIDLLHENGYYVAMESNGTRKPPFNLDWLTISPKEKWVGERGKVIVKKCNELKLVFDNEHLPDIEIEADYYYLQPCDTGNKEMNQHILNILVNYVKANPQWIISLQTQKMLKVR